MSSLGRVEDKKRKRSTATDLFKFKWINMLKKSTRIVFDEKHIKAMDKNEEGLSNQI